MIYFHPIILEEMAGIRIILNINKIAWKQYIQAGIKLKKKSSLDMISKHVKSLINLLFLLNLSII